MGRAASEEHFAIRAAWPIMLDIFAKDSADITGQRERPFAVSLRTSDVNHALVPIEVFQGSWRASPPRSPNLARSKMKARSRRVPPHGDWHAASTFSSSSAASGRGSVASYQRRTRGMARTKAAKICPSETRKRRKARRDETTCPLPPGVRSIPL